MTFRSTLAIGCLATAILFASSPARAQASAPEARFMGTDQLVIDFPQPVQAWENGVGDGGLRMQPDVPRTCRWDSQTRLACHFEKTPKLATRYRIDLHAGLKTWNGTRLPAQTVFAGTARPEVYASIREWRAGLPQIDLTSNAPLTPQALQAVLRLRIDGAPVALPMPLRIPSDWETSKHRRLRLVLPRIEGENGLMQLEVVPGLRTSEGPLPGTQDGTLLKVMAQEPFALRRVTCSRRDSKVNVVNRDGSVLAHCLPGMPIGLRFSQALSSDARERLAAQLPAGLKLSQQTWWYGDGTGDGTRHAPEGVLFVEAAEAQRSHAFTLDALRSEEGAPMAPVRIDLRTDSAPPQLAAPRTAALLADRTQGRGFPQATNAGDAVVDVDAVGGRTRRGTVRTRGSSDGASVPVTSSAARRALADGGWVRWTPRRAATRRSDLPGSRGPVELAAPAFDLYAVQGVREVLVWANEWDRDAAIAGANVELLLRERDDVELRVVARGTTGDDGAALLRLPDDLKIPGDEEAGAGPTWLLRATQRGRGGRAVLPISSDWSRLGHAFDRVTWGVSDRPMYRRGDTVHYRLWRRDRNGARLQALDGDGPLTLRLHNEYEGKAITQWQATPTPAGDIAGELVLPVHLIDGTYCIGVPAAHGYRADGACFFVGVYRAQDLWAQLSAPAGVLRDGQRFSAALKAGYFSGGTAAGVAIEQADLTIEPLAFDEAYPQYAQYSFIDVYDDGYDAVEIDVDARDWLDRDGQARLEARLPLDGNPSRPPFGALEWSTEVTPQGREGTVAYDGSARYSRYPSFVGLRTVPAWPRGDAPVELEGVVVDAEGQRLAEATITVDVEFASEVDTGGASGVLAQCMLRAGIASRCDFARPGSGRYRFTARSGDAAPVTMYRYLSRGDAAVREEVEETGLDLTADASSLHAALRQPFDRVRALFVFASHDRIDGCRVESVAGNVAQFELPLQRSAHSQVRVYVRASGADASSVEEGFRTPLEIQQAEARVPEHDTPGTEPAPVSVHFEPVRTAPGMRARVVLRNDSPVARDVVLSVMDDALRSLAQRWLDYADPHGGSLLGGLDSGRPLQSAGFGEFVVDTPWRYLLPWPEEPRAGDVGEGAANAQSLPPPPEEPPIIADDPSSVDMPAAAPASVRYNEVSGSTVLDRIEVTGSRISRSDLESREAKAPDAALKRSEGRDNDSEAPALARVRTRFADTAAWLADLRLAPGETRTVEVTLPDNLTRWRAVAWSSDADDGFAMAEATLETGLPLEARLQAPTRMYPGDQSRLIAHVRQTGESAADVETRLHFEGADAPADRQATLRIAANGQGSFGSVIAPIREGAITVVASASLPDARDAVAQPIEVASPRIAARKVLAGWLGEEPMALDVPTLPAGASDASMHVSLQHGVAGMVEDWTRYMQAYPHRCWEQILSRAVAAALALQRGDTSWPDAPAVVREALDNAAVFQDSEGGFGYFARGRHDWNDPGTRTVLTAYTVDAFALLRSLGHPVQADIEQRARQFLAVIKPAAGPDASPEATDRALSRFAFAAATRNDVEAPGLDALWREWDRLPLSAQVAAARALERNAHPAATQAAKRLVAATDERAGARAFRLADRQDEWMGSNLREQCSLLALLDRNAQAASADARRTLIAGLADLYGGTREVDTQSAATCLMALNAATRDAGGDVTAQVELGAAKGELHLAADRRDAQWNAPLLGASQLRIAMGPKPSSNRTTPASVIAELRYQEDARVARASAIGLAISRRYAVFRDGDWKPVQGARVREGDWVRITLAIDNTVSRRFIAVTDQVPGGLRPTDLSLSGVVVRDLQRASDTGSAAFATRRLDARAPKFYAETLPPGHHEVHYFAVAGNGGDYLAAPAVAEPMYGGAGTARTASARIRIAAAGP